MVEKVKKVLGIKPKQKEQKEEEPKKKEPEEAPVEKSTSDKILEILS